MDIENYEALREFLKIELSKLCSADPIALARYVIALLRQQYISKDKLKEKLLNQLHDFLLDHTKTFVDMLLDALISKSYLQWSNPGHHNENSAVSSNRIFSAAESDNSSDILGTAYSSKKKSKRWCKNYVEKGFCLNGDYCHDSHDDPVVVEDMSGFLYAPALPSNTNSTTVLSTPLGHSVPEYNPEYPYLDFLPPERRQEMSVPKEKTPEPIDEETPSRKYDVRERYLKRKRRFEFNTNSKKLKKINLKNEVCFFLNNLPVTPAVVSKVRLQNVLSKYGNTTVTIPFDGNSQTAKINILPNSDADADHVYNSAVKDLKTSEHFKYVQVSLSANELKSANDKEERVSFHKYPGLDVPQNKFLYRKNVTPTTHMVDAKAYNTFPVPDKDKKKLHIMKENLQKQEELIEASLKKQKLLLEELVTMNNKEGADIIKKQLSVLSSQTHELQQNLKKESENLKMMYLSNQLLPKSEIAKLSLDIDLDLYRKEKNSTSPTDNLISRVSLLKERAKAFVQEKSALLLQDNSPVTPKLNTLSHTIVYTPSNHLSKENIKESTSELEKISIVKNKNERNVYVTFENKSDAENALSHNSRDIKNINVSIPLSLFSTRDASSASKRAEAKSKVSDQNVPKFADGDEDEDEEEDSEARSWKR